jgi:hypothetical protein
LSVDEYAAAGRDVADPVAVEERLASLVNDSIAPHLAPELEVLPWRRTHVDQRAGLGH